MKKILLTGSRGLVGSRLAILLREKYRLIATDRSILDISDAPAVTQFVKDTSPDVIVNAAAFSDVTLAERERGDKEGMCWKVNALGTKNLVTAARTIRAFVVLLSTGSVFAGTSTNPGPFKERDILSPKKRLGWYAYTKLIAEQSGVDAVVRLSHVIGPQSYKAPNDKPDYLKNIIQLYERKQLYPLFTDQKFPVTYLDDIALAIVEIGKTRRLGKYHVVSSDVTTPYKLASYALKHNDLQTTSYKAFIRNASLPLRYSQYHAIDGRKSHMLLDLPKRSWKEIVDLCYL